MPPRNVQIKHLLDHRPRHFGVLLHQLAIHDRVLNASKSALPAFLGAHCLACVVGRDKIVVFTDAAAWSSQLRFYAPAMLRAINAELCGAYDKLQIRVLMPWNQADRLPRLPRLPSDETIGRFRQNAQHTPEGPLKHALLRLSKTLAERRTKTP